MNALTQFHDAILSHGWKPGAIIGDSKFHRFDIDQRRDRAGWYVFFGEAGAYGSWKGDKFKWSAENGDKWNDAQKAEFKRRMAQIEKGRADATTKAKERVQFICKNSTGASDDHPYLKAKGVKGYGIRQYKGALVVPVRNAKTIESVQFISATGEKRFLRDGRIQGNYSEIRGNDQRILCEGFSTAASIHEATGTPWNPGKQSALATAWKHNVKVAIPTFENTESRPTDFNDLMALQGLDAVKNQIEAAKYPQKILLDEAKEDPGAPFRPENLAGLRAMDQPSFERIRSKLKGLIRITALDQAIRTKKDSTKGSGTGDVDHLEAAKDVVESYGEKNILYSQSFPWKYNGKGLWEKLDDRELKSEIHKALKDAKIHRGIVESILDLLKTETYRPNHRFDVDTTAINCLNGELHWTGDKWKLREHKRENFRTTRIPVEYDPEARANRFERFLIEVFQKDSDHVAKAFLVCEALGYSLLSSTEYEKFFLLIGSGANGKSVLMDTLASLVGYEHVAAVQPSQFENRFQRAHLHCKLVNLVTEIAEGHEIADAQLKAIVSGELSTAEHKHKPPFDFQPYATCWFGSNHMPHTRDFSDALFRRAIILPFTRTFSEREQDKHLKAKLKEELPGILNLALEAIAGVFKRGEFTKTKSCEIAKKEWRLNCDQVQQFANDECLFKPGEEVPSGDIFKAYEKWSKESGIKRTVNRNNFTVRMCRLGAERDRGEAGIRLLAGVRLKLPVEK